MCTRFSTVVMRRASSPSSSAICCLSLSMAPWMLSSTAIGLSAPRGTVSGGLGANFDAAPRAVPASLTPMLIAGPETGHHADHRGQRAGDVEHRGRVATAVVARLHRDLALGGDVGDALHRALPDLLLAGHAQPQEARHGVLAVHHDRQPVGVVGREGLHCRAVEPADLLLDGRDLAEVDVGAERVRRARSRLELRVGGQELRAHSALVDQPLEVAVLGDAPPVLEELVDPAVVVLDHRGQVVEGPLRADVERCFVLPGRVGHPPAVDEGAAFVVTAQWRDPHRWAAAVEAAAHRAADRPGGAWSTRSPRRACRSASRCPSCSSRPLCLSLRSERRRPPWPRVGSTPGAAERNGIGPDRLSQLRCAAHMPV